MKKKTLNSKISQVFENMMIRITKLISSIRNKNNTFLKTKQFEQTLHSNKHCTLDEICNNIALICHMRSFYNFLPLLNIECEWHNGYFSAQKISLEHVICILIIFFKLFQLIRKNL